MDILWPTDGNRPRKWIQLGGRQYQHVQLYPFLPAMNLAPTEGQFPYVPHPYGGGLLHYRPNFVDVYNNAGEKVGQSSNVEAFREGRAAFWCLDGCVGILHHNAEIAIITTAGELLRRIPPPETSRVTIESPYPGGIACITETRTFWAFESVNWTWQSFAAGQIPANTAAIAYADGKGFLAYCDDLGFETGRGWLAQVGPDGLRDFDSLRFHPWGIKASPKADLVAAYDEHQLYIRSPSSQIGFPLISGQGPISSVAFIDEYTTVYVAGRSAVILAQSGQVHKLDEREDLKTIPLVLQGFDSVHIFYQGHASMITPIHASIVRLCHKPFDGRLVSLVSAKREFEDERIESYKILEDVKVFLEDLIRAILEAAINVIEKDPCERMLQHAAFAKYQLPHFDHNSFAQVVRDLQVINSLRSVEFGWLITGPAFHELLQDDATRLISNVIQLHNGLSQTAASGIELASQLCQQYGVNPAIVAENWASRMFREHKAQAVDIVLRKIDSFDPIDYVRLGIAAKKYTIDNTEIAKIIRKSRDPKVRMMYIMNDLQNDAEAMQDVLASMDGNAIITYLTLAKYRLPRDVFGARLAQNPILADQYAAYRQYSQYESIMQIDGYPPPRVAVIEMIHGNEVSFGKDANKLAEVGRKLSLAEKNSPLVLAIESQRFVIGQMTAIMPKDQPGRGISPLPTKSPRYLLAQGLLEGRDQLVSKIQKQYKISDKAFAWIQLRAFSQNKQWSKLAELARRSQPLPWDVYADACATNGRREEAVIFIKKISSAEQRLNLFQQYEYWKEAAQAAADAKNMQLYAELQARAQSEGDE